MVISISNAEKYENDQYGDPYNGMEKYLLCYIQALKILEEK